MNPQHFVATGYVVKNGKTLLLFHKKLALWLPPGGHIEEGESPDQAVLREILEETGLRAEIISPKLTPEAREKDVSFLHVPNHMQIETLPNHGRHIDLIYFCKVLGGQEKISIKESLDMKWCGPRELASDSIRDEVRRVALKAIIHVEKLSRVLIKNSRKK